MKYRASLEILDEKRLGFLRCLSNNSVRFDDYLCTFDFGKGIVEIHDKKSILFEGRLIGKKISKLQQIVINNCVIFIKTSWFSLVPFRDISIANKDYMLNLSGVSSSSNELNIGMYGSINIDYLGRWVDCDFNEKHLIEAMVITSFIYLFCNENRVSDG